MATYVLIPGAGGSSWYWHLVTERLERLGHDVVAPDLPGSDPSARLADYVDAVTAAAGGRPSPVIVAQSMGGLIAPIVADELGAQLLVLVAAMIPRPGETGGEWWEATGQPTAAAEMAERDGRGGDLAFDPVEVFLHDLPPDVLREAMQRPVEQADGPFRDPSPMATWPDVATRVIACRHDRLFPIEFMQQLSRQRLGIEPEVIDTGHLPALADADALVAILERLRSEFERSSDLGATHHRDDHHHR